MRTELRKELDPFIDKYVKSVMDHMIENYRHFVLMTDRHSNSDQHEERIADWASKLRFEFVNKYIKIWHDNTICLFVVNTLTDKKFSYGDILKPAGWRAPARNFRRGTIFEMDSVKNCVSWIGAQ